MSLVLNILYFTSTFFLHVSVGQQNGFCYAPFDSFIGCMIPEAQSRLDKFMLESSPVVQDKISYCFTDSGCNSPDFHGATLKHILPSPWPYRVNLLFDLFESAPKDVQSCMVDYLLEKAKNYTQTCIEKHGAGTPASQFKLKRLPKLENLNVNALKKAILNRIVVTTASIDCSKKLPENAHLQATLDCVKDARSDSSLSTCFQRDRCKKQVPRMCLRAFNAVESASCSCFKSERDKIMRSDLSGLKRIMDLFMRGDIKQQFISCCHTHNKPVPVDKLRVLSDAIRASTRDTLFKGLPKRVQQVSAQMIMQISEEVQKLLCGQACLDDGDSRKFKEAERIRKMDVPDIEERQEGFFPQAINTFFKRITG